MTLSLGTANVTAACRGGEASLPACTVERVFAVKVQI